VGLDPERLTEAAGHASPAARCRLHVGRALALRPSILLLEHVTASLEGEDVPGFAQDLVRVCEQRGLAMLALTEDRRFAELVAHRRLDLRLATGELSAAGWRRLLG
jgi:ABC-type polar amino acid transport system ATPase subunit